jgi:hypothetical protein
MRGQAPAKARRGTMSRYLILLVLVPSAGCGLLPEIAHQPTLHNPFPQLSTVAVAPFFNQSPEPTVDGRQFALAYFNELQLVPGFEVVPVDVVERTIVEEKIRLEGPADARKLAQILGVDAVVLGTVTDFSPYYPPRCGLRVEWYAANPCFHPIPPGYGLPWGTPGEKQIPGRLVLEAEMALAKEQLATQTPRCPSPASDSGSGLAPPLVGDAPAQPGPSSSVAPQPPSGVLSMDTTGPGGATGNLPGYPPSWPDPRGFISPPPSAERPPCWPTDEPVLEHTRTYNGHDSEFTEALANYYYFRDDARFGGWQTYLERSDDFIRFCCHMHIWEMLSARGGAGETRVVWRWPTVR